MIVLAIDTALEDCSVAIMAAAGVRLRQQTVGRGHAEILMPAIAALLSDASLAARDLERIVVSTGPGSFTGLRVGISAARGLAVATQVPVVGIPTLRAHAELAASMRRESGGEARPILALLPARADELYAQRFSAEGEPDGPLFVGRVRDLADLARAEDLALAGAGAAALGEGFAPAHLRSAPDIATLLTLGARLDPASHPPVPVYGKAPDAVPKADGIARR